MSGFRVTGQRRALFASHLPTQTARKTHTLLREKMGDEEYEAMMEARDEDVKKLGVGMSRV